MQTTQTSLQSVFPCPNGCGRQYKYKGNLTVHLKLECGKEKQFKCEYCEKEFHHKSHLKKHTVIVHRIIPY